MTALGPSEARKQQRAMTSTNSLLRVSQTEQGEEEMENEEEEGG